MKQKILILFSLTIATVAVLLFANDKATVLPDGQTADDVLAVRADQSVAEKKTATTSAVSINSSPPKRSKLPVKPLRNTSVAFNNKEYPVRVYHPLALPDDPLASQWWVTNATLDQAWEEPAGSEPMLLAVIDTGFALSHEEFSGRWHQNSGETGTAASENSSQLNCTDRSIALDASCNLIDDNGDGIIDNEFGMVWYENPSRLNCTGQSKPLTKDCNRIDDDNNGYIDDVTGWDFINYDNSVQAGELNPEGAGTTHGTRVAGVAAATGNNAKGIAGVDWHTKVLPLQALDDDSYGDTISVGRAIYYAVEQGADVISLSLGSDLPDEYVRVAVQAAIASGAVVVAATGNDGCQCIIYPANYPEVVAVGALHTTNQPASFSSWGANLDILAPGTQIVSADWTASNGTSAYVGGISGTSFATPLVSGLLTRLWSQRPDAAPLQIIAALTESVNRLNLATNVPRSPTKGAGSVDAHKATQRVTTPQTTTQLNALLPVSLGRQPGFTVSEVPQTYNVQVCKSNSTGTTPLYELTKASHSFFSVSSVEARKAQVQGYASSVLGWVCLQQPHDTAEEIRQLNVFHEFKNTYKRYLNNE